MHKFNPISDTSLFENIQTQHFYNNEDIKKDRLYQYIYWFKDYELKKKKDNEIFKKGVELNSKQIDWGKKIIFI